MYLKISPEDVWNRLKRDTSRPLLQCEDPYGKVCELLKERAPLYEEVADLVIEVGTKNMEQVLTEIVDGLAKRDEAEGI